VARFSPAPTGDHGLRDRAPFYHFFVKDYNRGGKRYVVYGPVALLLFVYAASLSGFF